MSQRFADPKLRFHELALRTLLPRRKPGTFLKPNLSLPKNRPQIKAFAPSILPVEKAKAGHVYFEHRLFKTKHRRKWYPNYRDHALPVTILGGRQTLEGKKMMMSPMKLRIEDVEAIETAGGVEPFLMHTRGFKLSDHGKMYRQHLFQELNRMRDTQQVYAGPSNGPKWINIGRPTPPRVPKPRRARSEAVGEISEGTLLPQNQVEAETEEALLISSSKSTRSVYGPGRHGIRAGGFSTTRLKTDEEIGRGLNTRDTEKEDMGKRKAKKEEDKARRLAEMRAEDEAKGQ